MNSDHDVNIHNKNYIYLSSCLHFGSSCQIIKILNRLLLVGGYVLNNILHSLFSTLQVFVAFPQVGHKNLMERRIAGLLLPHQILSNSDEWFSSYWHQNCAKRTTSDKISLGDNYLINHCQVSVQVKLTLTGSSTATETVSNLSLICVAPQLLILKMETSQFLQRNNKL